MNHIIGIRIGSEKGTYFINNEIYETFHAMIEVDGKLIRIKDENTPTKQVEGKTRHEARKKAAEVRDKLRNGVKK